MRVVVIDIPAEHVLRMPMVHDREPVEALGASGAEEALGDRVRLRRAHRCLDQLDGFVGEDGVIAAAELGVAVAEKEAETRRLRLECPGDPGGPAG